MLGNATVPLHRDFFLNEYILFFWIDKMLSFMSFSRSKLHQSMFLFFKLSVIIIPLYYIRNKVGILYCKVDNSLTLGSILKIESIVM
jgi:hypothetical protein